ncbi:MAG: amidohydrolase family protein [Chthoniobacterales bacterium]
MIVRARAILTMDGSPLGDGAVAIVGNRITDVGAFTTVAKRNTGGVLDLGDVILLPGLINAHCHLDYTALRGSIPVQDSFTAWIRAINERKATMSAQDFIASIEEGFDEAARFGTTTIVNLEAFPELIPRVRGPALRTWWCAELIDVRERVCVREVYESLKRILPGNRDGWEHIGLAPHAPYTASTQLYADADAIARSEDLIFTTHLSESRGELQMFRDATGPLFQLLKEIGRPMEDCGGRSSLAYLLARQRVDERWVVAHLNELSDDDFALLSLAKKFHIVHCPRSHQFFNHTPFAFRRLSALEFNICLGTDSLASNSDLSLFAEMREAISVHDLSPAEVLAATTVNGARALRREGELGRLRAGFHADMIAVPFRGSPKGAAEAVVAFAGAVPWMMVHGRVLRTI